MLKNNQTPLLNSIRTKIEEHPFAHKGVLDIDTDAETLVVLIDESADRLIIDITLRTLWTGPIEIYCASELMTSQDEYTSCGAKVA